MINYLSKRKENKKIAVIGDMLEIEPKSEFYHREIGVLINSLNNIDVVIVCGNYSKYIYQTVNCEKYYFEKAEDSRIFIARSNLRRFMRCFAVSRLERPIYL